MLKENIHKEAIKELSEAIKCSRDASRVELGNKGAS